MHFDQSLRKAVRVSFLQPLIKSTFRWLATYAIDICRSCELLLVLTIEKIDCQQVTVAPFQEDAQCQQEVKKKME